MADNIENESKINKLSVELPLVNYKIKDKLIYNGSSVFVSDIIFSMADFRWYAALFEFDANGIITKNLMVPATLLNESQKL